MNKIHRGDDYEGEIVISGTTLDELANIMIEVIDAKKNIIKKISLNEKTGYNSDDISQVDDTTVEFRIHRAETEEMALGKVNFRVSLAYTNEDFDDSIKIESDATNSLYIVSDSSETSLQDSVETISVASMAGEENTGENLGDGVGIYKEKSDVTLQFKTLVAGDNITIEANEDEETVTISAAVDSGDANNISDTDAEDLTDGGDSELHYHSSDRDRSNHTGTQLLETISDAGTLASKNTVSESEIDDEAVTDDKLSESGVTAGTYNAANVTVNSKGRITSIEEGEASSDVDLTNYFDKTSDTVSESLIDDGAVTDDKLSESGVTAGTYSIANVTVNSKGRITSIEEGSVSSSGVVDSEATEDSTNAAMSGDLWDTKQDVEEIEEVTDNLSAEETDTLYITDNAGNVIAKISAEGIKSVKFIDSDGEDISTKYNSLYGKSLYSIADSLGTDGVWQNKIADLTGMEFDSDINDGGDDTSLALSVGGTSISSGSDNGGQRRMVRLASIDAAPDYIIWENINDLNLISEGDEDVYEVSDEVPYMWTQDLTPIATVFDSQSAARDYWDTNYATILAAIDSSERLVGSQIKLSYTTNSIILEVTNGASADGNVEYTVGGTSYSIAVTSGMTASEVAALIEEWDYTDYTTSISDDTVTFTYTGTGSVGAYALTSYNSTGVVISDSTGSSEGTVNIWFTSKDTDDWETSSAWSQWTLNLYKWYKGLFEYVYKTFPNTKFYVLIPDRIAIDFNADTYKRADGSWDIDAFKEADGKYTSLVTMQKTVCEYYGVEYLDMTQTSNINLFNIETFGNSSNVHPTDEAYERWGEVISKLLK
jgi:hypothetical protein